MIIKKLKPFLMFFLCLIFFLFIPGQTVHATELGGNAAGSGGGDGTQTIVGGPVSTHTGWLTYIIDENNSQITETKVFYSSSERPDGSYMWYPSTKFGGSTKNYVSDGVAKWNPSPPFSSNGAANGSAVKSWMLTNENALYFIDDYYGAAILERFKKEKLFLILEPFYWGQMYYGSSPLGIYLCATAHGWADTQNRYNLGEYGSPKINRFTNNTYPNCVKLEYPQFGYSPASGKLTNVQIMTSGNGFMAIWASEDVSLPENVEETEDVRQLYAIKNWSDEYDISEGIPSGEPVMNAYEADAFYANTEVKTIYSAPRQYHATYTYKKQEMDWRPIYDANGDHAIDPETGDYMYYPVPYWATCATKTISFSASASYQILTGVEVYALDNLKVVNNSFDFAASYDKSNSSTWYDVTTDIRRYKSNGGYSNTGLLECKDIGESHYYLPNSNIIGNRTIYVESTSEAYGRMASDERAAMHTVYNASWSRNDNLEIKAGEKNYIFMKDQKVTGCIINGYSYSSAADSSYRYGGAGIYTDSVKPVRAEGESERMIPPSTDNDSYPTGVTVIYKNIANTKNSNNVFLRAGRGVYGVTAKVDNIYRHIIDSPNSYGAAHNHVDLPGGDGYDIKIHTPVVSPIMITTYLGTPQWYADEQLLDIDSSADFQLKLDANYMVKWNLDQWVSYKYGELMGYEEEGGFPSRYDQYVEKKELKFPFDVYYDSVYYKANTWITISQPNNPDIIWNEGLSLSEKSAYKSNNHWQMTPIYIPSYAKEGTGTIQARVYAYNVEGRYEGSHNVEESMELTKNTEQDNYIAMYNITEQLSGHIYGFTVTGVDDKDMYDKIDLEESIWDRIGYGFCPEKEEKVSGTKNRFGQNQIRYQADGSLTEFIIQEDGTIVPDYNLLPLREGSNETAGMHTGDGKLWLGTGFGFNLKTIANLWGNNDYIEIILTFKFYDKEGNLVDEIRMNEDSVESTTNRLKVFYDEEGTLRNFFNTNNQKRYTVAMGSQLFDSAYYTEEDKLQDGNVTKRYGSWVDYTLERWNKTNDLYGNAARTKTEMMDFKWPCYTNTLITLDSNFRMLSGEWEQLYNNRNREENSMATYYDFDEDGNMDEGIQSSMETDFRDSMQTWYGGYCMPGKLFVYDNKNHDFEHKDNLTMEDFTTDYDIIINFDIIAYKNGVAHLGYGGYINGGRVWEKEGYDTKNDTFEKGDVVIYDTSHSFSDKFEGHLINVN